MSDWAKMFAVTKIIAAISWKTDFLYIYKINWWVCFSQMKNVFAYSWEFECQNNE